MGLFGSGSSPSCWSPTSSSTASTSAPASSISSSPRSEEERQQAMRSIGPFWDGNEVWLLAAGGTLFFAFPLLYASAFSGFYLPLMIVLWLLILRAISIELRSHSGEPLWRDLLRRGLHLLQLAAGHLLWSGPGQRHSRRPPRRGQLLLPPALDQLETGPHPGILDWYTVTGGVLALVALAVHGALYLALKTEGELEQRARAFALKAWAVLLVLTAAPAFRSPCWRGQIRWTTTAPTPSCL